MKYWSVFYQFFYQCKVTVTYFGVSVLEVEGMTSVNILPMFQSLFLFVECYINADS
jgi:hypothetical protein